MKVALVHDWLNGMRGGEKCLEVFCEIFPEADLYTLIYLPDQISTTIRSMKVHPSWINRLPAIKNYYRYCLPLFPKTIERFDLAGYDLVLSSSHCVAKGVFSKGALHIAYIHSPMRYIWDAYDLYFGPSSAGLARAGMTLWRKSLQRWDIRSSDRVHFFVTGSHNIASKILRLYGREATVIHGPVDMERFHIGGDSDSYYLAVSALVPYKRIDVVVEAFNQLELPLKIAGSGPLRRALEKRAQPNIEFLGWVDDTTLTNLYASCQALVFPGEEDFGIIPLEAQASGRPVIAYAMGGALETVVPLNGPTDTTRGAGATGIFFHEPTSAGLIGAVQRYQKKKHLFDPTAIRHHASAFSREKFKNQIRDYVETRLREWQR